MNLSQLSNTYQFLYSPKSWLHVKNKNYKIVYFFLQLIILPYISLQYIVIIFTTTLIFFKFVNLPISIQKNLCTTATFFLLTLANNIHYTTKYVKYKYINNNIIRIKPFNFIDKLLYTKNYAFEKVIQYELYLSSSISRLIMISLTYLFTIKIFLLTTNYEEIIISLLGQRNITTIIQNSEIPFIVVLSSQFLKIIFTHIDKLKVAYLIRGIKLKENNSFQKNILAYFFLINGFFITFYTNIDFIAKTLHSRDLLSRDLYLINIYNTKK
uniref:hypothetical protein n=1 Tax=Lithothamnion corallioides TaxID=1277934 RepID=UPI0023F2CF82|nr:hypothetical protein P6G75_pgp037 [Lithothamnion corallioides]WEA77139.1 hypothetical protein [Lithothamnion corallioides]